MPVLKSVQQILEGQGTDAFDCSNIIYGSKRRVPARNDEDAREVDEAFNMPAWMDRHALTNF